MYPALMRKNPGGEYIKVYMYFTKIDAVSLADLGGGGGGLLLGIRTPADPKGPPFVLF